MSQVARAVDFVKQRGYARTTDIAKYLGMIPGDVDLLLAGQSVFVTCDVQVGDSKLKEYRLSTSPAHNFRAGTPVPPTPPEQASVAPTPIRAMPAAPARGAPQPEEPMAQEGTVAERVVAALQKHGKLDLDGLAKHAKTTKATLYTMTGTLVKNHGVRRVHGERGVYELGEPQPRQRVALAAGGELGRRKPGTGPYAGALDELKKKRASMLVEITKLEAAIEAVEALA